MWAWGVRFVDLRLLWATEAVWRSADRPQVLTAVRPEVAQQAPLLAGETMTPTNTIKCLERTAALLIRTATDEAAADGSMLSKGAIKRAHALATCEQCRGCEILAAITQRPALLNG